MKKRIILALVLAMTAICLLGIFAIRNVREPSLIESVQAALGGEWTAQSKTAITSRTFPNAEGETIVFYVCQTTYFTDDIPEITGINEALNEIIDPAAAETSRACTVSGREAVLYQKDGRAYLCWTYSAEYSFVIEYNPEDVTEADIIRMAESVPSGIPE